VLVEFRETIVPLALLRSDPVAELAHARRVQATRPSLSVNPLLDESALSEDPDVAGDRLLRHRERCCQLADGRFTAGEPGHDGATRGIG
jgi:hypothetical protein